MYNLKIYICFTVFDYISTFYASYVFEIFSEPKKTRIEILRIPVQISACELSSETIACIFGSCLYQNNLGSSESLCYTILKFCYSIL